MDQQLHFIIRQEYGRDCVKLVRDYEKESRKLADHRNHLRFSLRCFHTNITPNSLKIRTILKGYRVNSIVKTAERKLLNERIRQINYKIDILRSTQLDISTRLRDLLSVDLYHRVERFTAFCQKQQHEQSKQRQIKKYQLLVGRPNDFRRRNQPITEPDSRWVKNLTNRDLTPAQNSILSKGLNFAITPKSLPVSDIICSTEKAIHDARLTNADAESLRKQVDATIRNARLPPSNISKDEREAIKTLQQDPEIVILPADKGRCTVVMNREDYDVKVNTLLSDKDTYEELKKDPTGSFKRKISKTVLDLEKSNVITHELKRRLHPTSETIPTFYGLPKIHKPDIPLRPIVSSIDSVTYNISKHVASILAPLVGNTDHHIVNSQEFVEKIKELKVDTSSETLISYDVKSLFTCIPPGEAIRVVEDRLIMDSSLVHRTNLSVENIVELLKLCLESTYFIYGGKFFHQKHGCAMGSPVSPIIANLYMENFEAHALRWYTGIKPSVWLRYVDDTFVVIKQSEVEKFFEHINQEDRYIKFTQESMVNNSLSFLDCLVSVDGDGSLHCKVFRKPTHTDQYLSFDSHHPLQQKYGVVRTLFHRAESIVTDPVEKIEERTHISSALNKCGYPRWTFTVAQRSNENREIRERPTAVVSFPYVGGVSEKLQRICGQFGIRVAHRPVKTLRKALVHPKDKQQKENVSGVVYGIHCEGEECQEFYVGETEQPLRNRMYQHRRAAGEGLSSSVFNHMNDTGHSFKNENVEILCKSKNWFERGVQEAVYIKALNPSLNKLGGARFKLSSAWNGSIGDVTRQSGSRDAVPAIVRPHRR